MTNKINTGVWLDFKGAYLVTIDADGQASVQYLVSDVKHPASKGGTRSKTPWGPQFSPGDKNNLEREKHAERHQFGEDEDPDGEVARRRALMQSVRLNVGGGDR